jgi:hypothetical protein
MTKVCTPLVGAAVHQASNPALDQTALLLHVMQTAHQCRLVGTEMQM